MNRSVMAYLVAGRKAGLSLTSLAVVSALHAPAEVLTMTVLADLCGVTTAGMTSTIDRLEEAGVVRRMRMQADRRAYGVTLTEAGRRMADEISRRGEVAA